MDKVFGTRYEERVSSKLLELDRRAAAARQKSRPQNGEGQKTLTIIEPLSDVVVREEFKGH
jgi:hypothetical protein